ncbi:hypothetical protein AB6A23_15420 [Paenibacillus tarimensis]
MKEITMEKRLTRTEMVFSLGFLFMLVLAVAAFFYGLKVGSEKTESKYQPMKHLNATAAAPLTAYQQQDLVSFYHTVYLPYREFQNEWFAAVEKLNTMRDHDPSSSLKQLSKLAKKQYDSISAAAVPAVSPLLGEAQLNTLKGLKLFEQASAGQAASAGNTEPSVIINDLHSDAYYQEAVKHTLLAQQEYYDAMLKWGASIDPEIPEQYEMPGVLDTNTWKSQPLIVKNKVMADQLASRYTLTGFYPHDLSTRVDEFINSGEASKMKVKSITSIVDLLLGTKAVRPGDFSLSKAKLYGNELLPQLPFFYPETY